MEINNKEITQKKIYIGPQKMKRCVSGSKCYELIIDITIQKDFRKIVIFMLHNTKMICLNTITNGNIIYAYKLFIKNSYTSKMN